MKYDFIIMGGGIAGLNAALRLTRHGTVLVVTKEKLIDCNTVLAQGGIAASVGYDDSPDMHLKDTLEAGDGLCDANAVRVMVEEGPERIRDLIRLGVVFDTREGEFDLTREGAHSRKRVLHIGGDATGKYIWQTLAGEVYRHPNITVWEYALGMDLIVLDNVCQGIHLWDLRARQWRSILARAVLLASGGAGMLFPVTTNPVTATGDGMALAYRAGAELRDMEFIQFHPTALVHDRAGGFLISEAVRGEGGILRNTLGEAFMANYHPQAELAPRDIVARAIHSEMMKTASGFVYLDVTHFKREFFARRFPEINRHLLKVGIDAERTLIPVAPAAHYMMGGVTTDLYGQTTMRGLFAAGEVACTGVHGANRLASNSLLEGLVFSSRAAELMPLSHRMTIRKIPGLAVNKQNVKFYGRRASGLMQKYVGIVRDKVGLKKVVSAFSCYADPEMSVITSLKGAESRNLGLVGYLCALAALRRTESRGSHFRADFPSKNAKELVHITLQKDREENANA